MRISIQVRKDFSLFCPFFATRQPLETLIKSTASELFLHAERENRDTIARLFCVGFSKLKLP